jgi:hypothetical protein
MKDMTHAVHENFSRDETVTPGSDRSFGLIIAGALSALSLLNGWHGGRVWPWTAVLATLLAVVALLCPAALNPLNRAWLKFGLLLHKVINPIVMGLLFYGTVLPTGLVLRAMGRDLLRLRPQPFSDSYWIARRPPGPKPETMKDQF